MKKSLLLLSFFLFFALIANSQECPTGHVNLYNQQEIDSFAIIYPDCSVIEGNLSVYGNDITNLDGLAGISKIKGGLFIGGSMLSDLSGLNNLDSIYNKFKFYSTDALITLDGFNDLVYIGESLEMYWNENLSSITGFPNLTFHSGNEIKIYNNPNLQACTSPGLCSFIANPTCPVSIYDNAAGFSSPAQLAQSCNVPVVCLPYGHLYLKSQAAIDNFPNLYPGCTTLNGKTSISGQVTNLQGLSQVDRINGDLAILPMNLTSLQGLNNIDTITGMLGLYSWGLTNLDGLDSLKYIGLNLEMTGMSQLTDISGLSNLTHVGGGLTVFDNTALASLKGLDSIQSHSLQSVTIYFNTLLNECEIKSICDYLADTSANTFIYDNGPGCATVEQVREACETVNAGNINPHSNITVYPNPTKSTFILSGDIKPGDVLTLYNYSGTQLMEITLRKPESVINLSPYPPGLYLATVRSPKGFTPLKILKQ